MVKTSLQQVCYDKNMETDITGHYRHYKGNEYEVIGEGTHTETEERFVVYKALYEPYGIWVRPFDMFFEPVVVDGQTVPRFAKLKSRKEPAP